MSDTIKYNQFKSDHFSKTWQIQPNKDSLLRNTQNFISSQYERLDARAFNKFQIEQPLPFINQQDDNNEGENKFIENFLNQFSAKNMNSKYADKLEELSQIKQNYSEQLQKYVKQRQLQRQRHPSQQQSDVYTIGEINREKLDYYDQKIQQILDEKQENINKQATNQKKQTNSIQIEQLKQEIENQQQFLESPMKNIEEKYEEINQEINKWDTYNDYKLVAQNRMLKNYIIDVNNQKKNSDQLAMKLKMELEKCNQEKLELIRRYQQLEKLIHDFQSQNNLNQCAKLQQQQLYAEYQTLMREKQGFKQQMEQQKDNFRRQMEDEKIMLQNLLNNNNYQYELYKKQMEQYQNNMQYPNYNGYVNHNQEPFQQPQIPKPYQRYDSFAYTQQSPSKYF